MQNLTAVRFVVPLSPEETDTPYLSFALGLKVSLSLLDLPPPTDVSNTHPMHKIPIAQGMDAYIVRVQAIYETV